jgi:hypothetical protein
MTAIAKPPTKEQLQAQVAYLEAEIERMRAALRATLKLHGKPRREEWLNDAAYKHAIEVHEAACRALEGK